jgi:hypothetical protein
VNRVTYTELGSAALKVNARAHADAAGQLAADAVGATLFTVTVSVSVEEPCPSNTVRLTV